MAQTEPTSLDDQYDFGDVDIDALDDDALLALIARTTNSIQDDKARLDSGYRSQKHLFAVARERKVTNRRIAEAAGISEEAVIQRLRPPKTKKS